MKELTKLTLKITGSPKFALFVLYWIFGQIIKFQMKWKSKEIVWPYLFISSILIWLQSIKNDDDINEISYNLSKHFRAHFENNLIWSNNSRIKEFNIILNA